MARYADIDKLIADGWHLERHGESGRFLQSMSLADVQTADVVEVVRCKDCKYWTGKYYDGCCIKNGLATRFENDFCSYGERREDGSARH